LQSSIWKINQVERKTINQEQWGLKKNEVNVNLVRRGDYSNDLSFSINFFCGLLNDIFPTPIPPLLIWQTENQKQQEKMLPQSLGDLSVQPVFPIT